MVKACTSITKSGHNTSKPDTMTTQQLDDNTIARIKTVIIDYAELHCDTENLSLDDNLFTIGMSSRASVNLMIGLEAEFDIEFPEDMLRKEVFESIRAIGNAIETLTEKI